MNNIKRINSKQTYKSNWQFKKMGEQVSSSDKKIIGTQKVERQKELSLFKETTVIIHQSIDIILYSENKQSLCHKWSCSNNSEWIIITS